MSTESIGNVGPIDWSNPDLDLDSVNLREGGGLAEASIVIEETSELSEADQRVESFLEDDSQISEVLPEGKLTGVNKFLQKHKKLKYLLPRALIAGGITVAVGGVAVGVLAVPAAVLGAVALSGVAAASTGALLGVTITAAALGAIGVIGGFGAAFGGVSASMLANRLLPTEVNFDRNSLKEKLQQNGLDDEHIQKAMKEAEKHMQRVELERSKIGTKVRDRRAELAFNVKYDPDLSDKSKGRLLKLFEQKPELKWLHGLDRWEDRMEQEALYAKQLDSGKGKLIELLDELDIDWSTAKNESSSYTEMCDHLREEVIDVGLKNNYLTQQDIDKTDAMQATRFARLAFAACGGKQKLEERAFKALQIAQLQQMTESANINDG